MHTITRRVALAALLTLGLANNTKALTAPGLIMGGVGAYAGCYAVHMTFKSEKTWSDKFCGLIKAGGLGTVCGLCLMGAIFS